MKNIAINIVSIAALALLTSACNDDFHFADSKEGEGKILLRPVINSNVSVVSRAIQSDGELAENAIIWISNSEGVVRKYNGVDNIPQSGISLVSDDYFAEVWAGDSVSASFDNIYYKGTENFTVSAGSITQVDIQCRIANVVVEVVYDEAVDDALSDYSMTVSHRRGELTFTGRDDANRPGYFMMPSSDKNLKCVLTGTKPDGSVLTVEKLIEEAKPTTKYILHVKHGGPINEDFGGAIINVTVEEQPIETIENDNNIFAAPTVEGTNFDITKPIMGQEGALTEKKLWIRTTSPFKKVEIRGDEFDSIFGIGGDDFEIFAMDEQTKSALNAKGFSYQIFTHEDDESIKDCQEMKIIFHENILNSYKNGEHQIDITVADENGKEKQVTVTIILSDAKVKTDNIKDIDVWATSATIPATLMKAGQTGVGFKWRKKGATEWTFVAVPAADGAEEGTSYSAELTGLQPATDYQYMAVCDGFETADILSFTTEKAVQLPNSSFEVWSQPAKPWLPYTDAANAFWDSGNHGSTTLNASGNITTPSTDFVKSGVYSVKLQSKFIAMTKFAAGNIFAGEYLATEGTDGVLGWGRQFTARPKALRAYVKYTPGAINRGSVSDIPGNPVAKGDNDRGIIYVALLDNSVMKTYSNKSYPVIIKTKTKELFDKTANNVIAYGEKIWSEATDGDGLIEVTIPIDYYKTDVKPSFIVVTCSASQYGDYFVGSDSSVMYIDDFELVY